MLQVSPLSGNDNAFCHCKSIDVGLPWKNSRQVTTMAIRASVIFSRVEIFAGYGGYVRETPRGYQNDHPYAISLS